VRKSYSWHRCETFKCKVDAFWDSEALTWVAIGDDVPGLVTEASTIEVLTQKFPEIIPELIRLNKILPNDYV
jgi:Domain of unknown function (DUF1902)